MKLRLSAVFLCALSLFGQGNAAWKRPYPAHKIAGNLYYVGTEDLACFLISTPEGHILINTGLVDSTPLIQKSFQQLGFRLEDVGILLNMQAHFDHVAAMAEIRKISGAKVFATVGDAPSLEDGGKSDPVFGSGSHFAPVKVDRRLKDGDMIKLGHTELKVISTPGHTKGSVSYMMSVTEGGKRYSVGIINMSTVVMPLKGNSKYSNIVKDYEQTFEKQKQLSPEIWVAAHGSQYDMQRKHKAGSFVDPEGYKQAIAKYEQEFRTKLAQE